MNIHLYHWFWYLLGFIFCPRLTIMIFISLYFKNYLPLPLFVIGRILKLIGKIWKKNPDLRLCQLIGNLFVGTGDLYYVEDDRLERILKEEVNNIKRRN